MTVTSRNYACKVKGLLRAEETISHSSKGVVMSFVVEVSWQCPFLPEKRPVAPGGTLDLKCLWQKNSSRFQGTCFSKYSSVRSDVLGYLPTNPNI